MGDFDLIPSLLKQQGFKIFWSNTGIKPGNPMTFSQNDDKYCFGLSGNPVSSLVQFELIAKPVVYQLLGANFSAMRIKASLSSDYLQNVSNRLIIVPVIINEQGLIEEIPFHGSAHINALANANAFMEIEPGVTKINKGELVYVRPL